MSEKNMEEVKEKVIADNPPQNQDHCEKSVEEIPGPVEKEENPMPSPQQEVSAVSVFMVWFSCMSVVSFGRWRIIEFSMFEM